MAGVRTVAIRADATSTTGAGHLVRALAVARAAEGRGWRVRLVGTFTAALAPGLLADASASVEPADADLDDADVVHVDHYGIGAGWPPGGPLVSVMADAKYGLREADLIVDPSPTAREVVRAEYLDAAVGVGPRWVPLRPQFAAPAPSGPRERAHVVVMLGGTDAQNLTDRVVDAVVATGRAQRVTAVVPSATEDLHQHRGGVAVDLLTPRPDIARLLRRAALVISAAGTSVWELAALHTPAAVIAVADNQQDNYRFVTTRGSAVGLGWATGDDWRPDPDLLRRLVERPPAPRDIGLSDARGAERIVTAWDTLLADREASWRLRPAQDLDAGRLFAWRDDPRTREASRTTDPLRWADHLDWLDRTLASGPPPDRFSPDDTSTERRLWIAVSGGQPVANVRIDRLSEPGTVEVSIATGPQARGRGHAGRAIGDVLQLLRAEPAVRTVVAELRSDNLASRRLFEGLEFIAAEDRRLPDGWLAMTYSVE